MKNLNQINEIMESLRYTSLKIDAEDIGYISEMLITAAKFDTEYAEAYSKLSKIFKHELPDKTESSDTAIDKINKMTDEAMAKIDKMDEIAQAKIHQELEAISTNTIAQAEKDMSDAIETATEDITTQEEEDFREAEVEVPTTSSESEAPIIFQHPDYPTIGAGTDGQVYALKDGKWKKADTRTVYFPRKKDGTWGRVERQEILDLLNNYNTSSQTDEPTEKVVVEEEYVTLPDGYFIHPTLRNLAANEDGKILKYNPKSKKWTIAGTSEDGRGCRQVRGERIGTGKCVYECINRHIVRGHVRHLNGDSWDDAFSNLTAYGDKNYHKFQQRTYGEADIHEICEYICKHNGDVSNIAHDTKGKYSIYYARKILTKSIHDNISDKYFGYTSGGTLKIYKEGEVK